MSKNSLFGHMSFGGYLQSKIDNTYKQIDLIPKERLLDTTVDSWCDYFEQLYNVEVPQLIETGIEVDYQDYQSTSRHQPNVIIDKGTEVTYYLPFSGDRDLFLYWPSACTRDSRPKADIRPGTLVLRYVRSDHLHSDIKQLFDIDLKKIRECLQRMVEDSSAFVTSNRAKVRARLLTRHQKVLAVKEMVASLGFPLRRCQNAQQTYVAPITRKKIRLPVSTLGSPLAVPEPELDMSTYEDILSIISNMVMVVERSPRAFRTMREEDLRMHFLVQLNGQYDGQATGETFNLEGKTDILIRVNGRNIFIAECKFWEGPKELNEAIDQLLGYVSWRDTKTAILLFNRNKNLSSVLAKIPQVVETHPNFISRFPYEAAAGFRFALHHRDDQQREILLTVLAFEMPR